MIGVVLEEDEKVGVWVWVSLEGPAEDLNMLLIASMVCEVSGTRDAEDGASIALDVVGML